jgi:hypothetical protein
MSNTEQYYNNQNNPNSRINTTNITNTRKNTTNTRKNNTNTRKNNNKSKYVILKKIINDVINKNNKSTLHKILDILSKNSSNEEKQKLLSYKNKNKSELKNIFKNLTNQKLEEIIINSILYKEIKKNTIPAQTNKIVVVNKRINIPPITNQKIITNQKPNNNQKIVTNQKPVNKKNNQLVNKPKINNTSTKPFFSRMLNFFYKPFKTTPKNQKS